MCRQAWAGRIVRPEKIRCTMKIVAAFDSYKDSLSAPDACAAVSRGITRLSPSHQVISCPLSDGGEGFVKALTTASGGTIHHLLVTGPLLAPVLAIMGMLPDNCTVLIEAAQACGLELLPASQRSPCTTTTIGVGEMIRHAIAISAKRLIIGLGGSATCDAGLGMLSTLGWRFLGSDGQMLSPIGASLHEVVEIIPGPPIPAGIEIIAACDVSNPLFGRHGAAYTYAPQKGASTEEVAQLDAGLRHFASCCEKQLGIDGAECAGAGAAGGLGYALQTLLGASFQSGASIAITYSRLVEYLCGADLCFTGEGRTDQQTVAGKLPAAVSQVCASLGIPCVCLSGALGDGWEQLYHTGATSILSITQRPASIHDAIANTDVALSDTAEALVRLFAAHR